MSGNDAYSVIKCISARISVYAGKDVLHTIVRHRANDRDVLFSIILVAKRNNEIGWLPLHIDLKLLKEINIKLVRNLLFNFIIDLILRFIIKRNKCFQFSRIPTCEQLIFRTLYLDYKRERRLIYVCV